MNNNLPIGIEKKPGTLYGKVVARKQPEKAAHVGGSRLVKTEKTTEKMEKAVAVKAASKNASRPQKKSGQGGDKQPRVKEASRNAPESALKNAPCKPEKSVLLPEVLT